MPKPTFGSIIRNNLLALLAAVVLMSMLLATEIINDSYLKLFGLFYAGQVLYNLVQGIVHLSRPNETGAAPYFLSMLLLLIIGFGSCVGLISVFS